MKLSANTIKLFTDCPRCLWLEKKHKIKRPSGAFPSLPRGIDEIMKNYFDKYRKHPSFKGKLPPEIKLEGFNGRFWGETIDDLERLNKWRDWRKSDLEYVDPKTGDVLCSVIDDLLISDNGLYCVLDNKSRSSAPKTETIEMYKNQIGIYDFCLNQKLSAGTVGYGFLNFVWPKEMSEGCIVDFDTQSVKVPCDNKEIKDLFERACACIRSEQEPESGKDCVYCEYMEKRK
jgi:hypothetical protein